MFGVTATVSDRTRRNPGSPSGRRQKRGGNVPHVALDFDQAALPALPKGWVRDYFFAAHGYEKDMDFYAYRGETVEPLPFRNMGTYPYSGKSFPGDAEHSNYLLEYNTRFMSGNEAGGYSFRYPK